MNIGWIFPANNGGQMSGFNDGAMDHFKGDRSASIVRETIQNSLDVCQDSTKPVVVAFSLDELPASEVGAVSELENALTRSRAAEQAHHSDTSNNTIFYDNAISLAKSPVVKMLGIHDFNTTGLQGPTQITETEAAGAWLALVKGAGLSVKSREDSGGSFGHGSKAPIAASRVRTTFYYTQIERRDGATEVRFQGKSILQSHFDEAKNLTQGTGYFGLIDKASPLIDNDVPTWPRQLRENIDTGYGTSIYVPFPGLHDNDEQVWEVMKRAVLANFYYAILRKSLVVHFGDGQVFNHENVKQELRQVLSRIAEEASDDDSDSIATGLQVAKTVLEPTAEGTFESENFGTINWFIKTGDDVLSKRVSLSRNGMLITTTASRLGPRSFQNAKPFDLFVSVEGIGSSIMKSMENPEHNNIQIERIDDEVKKKEVKRKYDKFVEEIRKLVLEHAAKEVVDEASISDLDDLFGGSQFDKSRSEKGEISTELIIGKIKKSKIIEGADTDVPDPDAMGDGRGETGGDGKTTKPGGNISDMDGDQDKDGAKRAGKQVRDFRVVRNSAAKNVVTIFFTPVAKGEFDLAIFRSGETEREPIELRKVDNEEWVSKVAFKANNLTGRISVEVEIKPEDFDFALEGVMLNGK